MKLDEDVILIAGPTASGKTQTAIDCAKVNDGVVINADSMQVYSELQVVTARPSPQEEAQCVHCLFGHVAGGQAYSVARWLEDVKPLLEKFLNEGRKIVFAGGTGLYFHALTGGLSSIPEIEPGIREKWRRVGVEVPEELHPALEKVDPVAAGRLEPGDTQRLARALEVFESTGRPITEWQDLGGEKVLPEGATVKKFLLMPQRATLHERINNRFDRMIEEGALEEVGALLELNYPQNLPVMKAIGVPQLAAHVRGELSLDEAVEKAKAATRQYCKRQSTWFNNSFDNEWERVGDGVG